MSLVLEDGTGTDPLANSYASLVEFASYWTDRGFDYTVYTSPSIERSLIIATDYIDLNNGRWFKGYPIEDAQPLSFPRSCIYIDGVLVEGIPVQLKRATFEYAKRVLLLGAEVGLMPDPADRDETGATVSFKYEKIGPIETKTNYIVGSASSMRSYPAADKWLECLLRSAGGGVIRN